MKELIFRAGENTVHIYCDAAEATLALDEARHRGVHLGGPYSAAYHKAHTNPGEDHVQVYMRNNKLFALNVGGTAHDGSHGIRIPNRVAKGLQARFPHLKLPKDNIIECITPFDKLVWLTEEAAL
jgi:hypothetical protein